MDTTYHGFRAHYAGLTDDDLHQIAVGATDLVDDAQRALTEELASRGITSADTTAYRVEAAAHDVEHQKYLEQRRAVVEREHRTRLGLNITVIAVLFFFGAWRFLVDHGRGGIAIMASCAIALPIVFLHAYIKKRVSLALLTR